MNRDHPGTLDRRGRARLLLLKELADVVLILFVAPCLLGAQTPQTPARAAASNAWMNEPPTSTGIAVGQKVPAFQAADQNGKTQDFDSIKGSRGAILYFMRSADW